MTKTTKTKLRRDKNMSYIYPLKRKKYEGKCWDNGRCLFTNKLSGQRQEQCVYCGRFK